MPTQRELVERISDELHRQETRIAELTERAEKAEAALNEAEAALHTARVDAERAHSVWTGLALLVGCSSLDGDAELGQVQHIKELLASLQSEVKKQHDTYCQLLGSCCGVQAGPGKKP